MTVGELKKILSILPDEEDVVIGHYFEACDDQSWCIDSCYAIQARDTLVLCGDAIFRVASGGDSLTDIC